MLSRTGNGQYPSALQAAQRWAHYPGLGPAQKAEAVSAGAKVRFLEGDYPGAAEDYTAALAMAPNDPVAELGLARALGETPEKALPHAENAAKNASTPARRTAAWNLAGEIRLDLGDESGAKSAFEEALKASPGDLEALRGMVRANRRHPKEAAAFAEQAMSGADDSAAWYQADVLRVCARIWLEINDYARAEECLLRALARNPDDLDSLELLVQLKHEGPRRPPVRLPPPGQFIPSAKAPPIEPWTSERAEAFTEAIDDMPAEMQAPAYLLITRRWLELGNRPMAEQTLWKLRDLDPRSLSTAKLGEEMKVPGPTSEDAQSAIDRARAELTGAP